MCCQLTDVNDYDFARRHKVTGPSAPPETLQDYPFVHSSSSFTHTLPIPTAQQYLLESKTNALLSFDSVSFLALFLCYLFSFWLILLNKIPFNSTRVRAGCYSSSSSYIVYHCLHVYLNSKLYYHLPMSTFYATQQVHKHTLSNEKTGASYFTNFRNSLAQNKLSYSIKQLNFLLKTEGLLF